MKLLVRHETCYRYDAPVRSLTQYLRLTPRDSAHQKVLEWTLEAPGEPVCTRDGYGNVLHVLTLDKPLAALRVLATGHVQTKAAADEVSDFPDAPLSPLLFLRATPLTRADDALAALAEKFRRRTGSLSGLRELAVAVREAHRSRSSEDVVHAFIACCRLLGVPARYVSGYVAAGGREGAVANHAWAEAWLVDHWHSFDVAAERAFGEGHVKVAIGADYLDACPLRGVRVGGGTESMTSQAEIVTAGQ